MTATSAGGRSLPAGVDISADENSRARGRTQPRHRKSTRESTNTVRSILHGAGVRILVLGVSAILGIVSTRLIIGHFGRAAYAQYGLLVGLVTLLPFADLGMSAAITNAVATSDEPATDDRLRRVLITSLRVLFCSAAVLILVAITLGTTGVWPKLIGRALMPGSGAIAASLCLVFVALALQVGFGQRILTGLGRNHINIAILGVQTPVVLLVLLVMVHFAIPGGAYLAVVAYAATLLLSLGACWVAARAVAPVVGQAIRGAIRVRSIRGASVFGTAWPTLVQMIALPIAMQTDRIVLSHVSSVDNLAQYNLAYQIFNPVWMLTSAAGVALWPIFARARAKGVPDTDSPHRLSIGFGGAAGLLCGLLAVASPWLTARASGGQIHLSALLIMSFSVLMVFQAVKYPLGMYMTDPRGLRYQAYLIALFVPVNLGLSWYFAAHIGAPGPVIGSAVGVFGCQVVANWVYVRREQRRRALHRRALVAASVQST